MIRLNNILKKIVVVVVVVVIVVVVVFVVEYLQYRVGNSTHFFQKMNIFQLP